MTFNPDLIKIDFQLIKKRLINSKSKAEINVHSCEPSINKTFVLRMPLTLVTF